MSWFISLEQFEAFATARPEPPYFLWIVGLLITIVCALPFFILVRQRLEYWSKNDSVSALPVRGSIQIILPFFGMMSGVYIFIAAGLEVLGVPILPALLLSFLLILLISYLSWLLLGRVLSQQALRRYLRENATLSSHSNQ
ncbi:hypothetical protein ACQ4M3_36720 [Leptolyngbya sp. AN03gr2]|uniref:hypothetical protein n=1 Tax=unclassified Leptolyngbya TaxID=2650499 RepID=UPI003D3155A6